MVMDAVFLREEVLKALNIFSIYLIYIKKRGEKSSPLFLRKHKLIDSLKECNTDRVEDWVYTQVSQYKIQF